ncbi:MULTISPECIES: hypothetical protein [Citrobacter]|uniref:hypothetical protein n=1 Tax=Citrobacter TaxID=544 RepID=UPI000FD77CA2|nr:MULTISPECIES: hypothetical protein [Citrobacter]EJC6095420.1 hypothetical protein [Citrobacter freundii]EKX9625858.1 hypothetical protein [Citrobacter freundii]MBJ9000684.1 hypothetical protein [Citrobacter freundii]MBJ9630869.1 hypothetical protein [Citrobacter freundii]MDM3226430.1 hypothetical protein [Citrobacter sp. Cf087]
MGSGNGFTPLVKTLTENKDVFADIADASLEAAEAIPVFGWAVKAWNVKNTYQATKLYRNTQAFIESTSITDAQRFIDRFSTDDEKSELCDSVIQVLIDSEKPFKARLASKLLNSIYDGKIAVADANELLLIIFNASLPALKALDLFFRTNPQGYASTRSPDAMTLSPLLMSMGIIHVHGTMTRVTQLGQSLHQHAFA